MFLVVASFCCCNFSSLYSHACLCMRAPFVCATFSPIFVYTTFLDSFCCFFLPQTVSNYNKFYNVLFRTLWLQCTPLFATNICLQLELLLVAVVASYLYVVIVIIVVAGAKENCALALLTRSTLC